MDRLAAAACHAMVPRRQCRTQRLLVGWPLNSRPLGALSGQPARKTATPQSRRPSRIRQRLDPQLEALCQLWCAHWHPSASSGPSTSGRRPLNAHPDLFRDPMGLTRHWVVAKYTEPLRVGGGLAPRRSKNVTIRDFSIRCNTVSEQITRIRKRSCNRPDRSRTKVYPKAVGNRQRLAR